MVKFADTQKDKEQRRLQQQLAQQMQQLNSATTWGSLTGLGGLTPQYLAVRVAAAASPASITSSITPNCSPVANAATVSAPPREISQNPPCLLSSSFFSHHFLELLLPFILLLSAFQPVDA